MLPDGWKVVVDDDEVACLFPWAEGSVRIIFNRLIVETFSIDDTHLFHPQGEKEFILDFVFIAFCFGVRVHVGVKMVMELLLRDVGGRSKE